MTLDEKDWIIMRLLRVVLEEGKHSSHSDVIRSIDWMTDRVRAAGYVEDENKYKAYGLATNYILHLMNDLAKEFDPKPLPKHWRRS